MLWNSAAKDCPYRVRDVLTIHGVKITWYGTGRVLSAISGTSIVNNHNSAECYQLKKLMDQKYFPDDGYWYWKCYLNPCQVMRNIKYAFVFEKGIWNMSKYCFGDNPVNYHEGLN